MTAWNLEDQTIVSDPDTAQSELDTKFRLLRTLRFLDPFVAF